MKQQHNTTQRNTTQHDPPTQLNKKKMMSFFLKFVAFTLVYISVNGSMEVNNIENVEFERNLQERPQNGSDYLFHRNLGQTNGPKCKNVFNEEYCEYGVRNRKRCELTGCTVEKCCKWGKGACIPCTENCDPDFGPCNKFQGCMDVDGLECTEVN